MNNRPSLGSASEITNEVLAYLGQNKVILDLGHAEEAAGLRARGRSALEAADKERKTTTENWREATKAENAIYKTVLDPLKAALEKLTDLVANYVRAEESVRAAQAERLRVERRHKRRKTPRKRQMRAATVTPEPMH